MVQHRNLSQDEATSQAVFLRGHETRLLLLFLLVLILALLLPISALFPFDKALHKIRHLLFLFGLGILTFVLASSDCLRMKQVLLKEDLFSMLLQVGL